MCSSELRLNGHLSRWAVQALARLFCTFGIIQGVLVIHGGRRRWSSPAFDTALNVPGAPASWGVAILVIGIVGLYGTLALKLKVVFFAMWAISCWFMFFTISLLHAALKNPDAATTGIITYGTMGITAAVLGIIYKVSH